MALLYSSKTPNYQRVCTFFVLAPTIVELVCSVLQYKWNIYAMIICILLQHLFGVTETYVLKHNLECKCCAKVINFTPSSLFFKLKTDFEI